MAPGENRQGGLRWQGQRTEQSWDLKLCRLLVIPHIHIVSFAVSILHIATSSTFKYRRKNKGVGAK